MLVFIFVCSSKRAQDIKTKKHHVPVVDRTPLEPPPIVIVVVGPPKVGKSTLIRCLIKNFTRQKLTDICGPVTIVSGEQKLLKHKQYTRHNTVRQVLNTPPLLESSDGVLCTAASVESVIAALAQPSLKLQQRALKQVLALVKQ